MRIEECLVCQKRYDMEKENHEECGVRPAPEGEVPPRIYCTGFPGDEEAWCLWWHNPWDGKPEKIAYFYWPAHPAEATKQVEDLYETLARGAVEAHALLSAEKQRGLRAVEEAYLEAARNFRECGETALEIFFTEKAQASRAGKGEA